MDIKTHQKIDQSYCGKPVELKENYAKVALTLTEKMMLDESGLIHGGFIFSMADYAAMLAINHPNVVLGGANVRFLVPVKKGDKLIAEAQLAREDGKKLIVDVNIVRENEVIFIGEFYCFTPEKHVLS